MSSQQAGRFFSKIDRRGFLRRVGLGGAALGAAQEGSNSEDPNRRAQAGEGLASLVSRNTPGKPMARDVLRWLAERVSALHVMWRPKAAAAWQGSISEIGRASCRERV